MGNEWRMSIVNASASTRRSCMQIGCRVIDININEAAVGNGG